MVKLFVDIRFCGLYPCRAVAQFAILFDGTGGSHARRFVVEPLADCFHTVVLADTVNAGGKSPDIGRVGRKKSKCIYIAKRSADTKVIFGITKKEKSSFGHD